MELLYECLHILSFCRNKVTTLHDEERVSDVYSWSWH